MDGGFCHYCRRATCICGEESMTYCAACYCQKVYCRKCKTTHCQCSWAAWREEVLRVRHGINCEKIPHGLGPGFLHGALDDTPYDVDGCSYCGRCHISL